MSPQNVHSCGSQDTENLPDKQILFKYDCDCVPLFENQLGAQDARDSLASFWGIQLLPNSQVSSLGHSVTAAPLSDSSGRTTLQTKCPFFRVTL